MGLIKKIQDMKQEMTRWRQKLHAEPELAFEERKTARFISRQLESFGLDEVHGMAKTGVVGVLHGKSGPKKPEEGGRAIMLRADMDALPVTEETGAVHASRTPGVMHACGHDGHMAMLLGAAKYLSETRDFEGTVYFVFQPAEEHIGGAKEMIKEGFFDKFPCDEVYGLHNFPALPLGMMATRKGAMLAASDEYHVTIRGTGGHSARPENTTDITAATAEIILAIKDLAKNVQGEDPSILSVCAVHTGSDAANVLPDKITFNGSIRTFDRALHAELKEKLETLVAAVSEKYGAAAKVEFKNGYPLLVNADAETDFAALVAKEIVGDDKVMENAPRTLGVEDFAAFLEKRPGNFMAIGTGKPDGAAFCDIHSAKYDFNDAALPYGASYWARLVEKALPPKPAAPDANGPAPKI